VLALGGSVLAVGGATKRVVAKSEQGGLVVVSDDPDATSAAAVAPVRAALGDVGLAAKAHATSAAITSLGVELGGIDEGGHGPILRDPPKMTVA
jgi:hypothetical protein